MGTLVVDSGYRTSMEGLGRNRGILRLSQKRVSKAVREALRRQFGEPNISVSCTPELVSDGWHGECEIYKRKCRYKITA
jgi:hypothetical protein